MIRIMLWTILLSFSFAATAEKIYKWVDENGQIHYSSKKPPGQEVETVKIRKGPKVTAPSNPEPTEEAAEDDANEDPISAEDEAAAREQLAAADRVNRQKQCDTARKNLNALNASVRVVRTNEQGEAVRMTDEERVRALATAQKAIDQYCN